MTVADIADAPRSTPELRSARGLRCVGCNRPIDFAAGETADILRHVAYGFGLAHPGDCLAAALEAIFVEPGYDCATYARDRRRRTVLASHLVQHEPRRWRAVVEYADGARRVDYIVWDADWLDEPGALEFVTG